MKVHYNKPILWVVFVLYLILCAYAIVHHELWGDEIHSWNISKGSAGYFNLIANTRYEGHPPVWYSILWAISKLTHDPSHIQAAQFVIAGLVVFLVLFFAPYPMLVKILLPFGYFFLFEYGIFTRNYAIGVLLAFNICMILNWQFYGKTTCYYVLLFLLSNTHLLAIILAASLHLYFLISKFEQRRSVKSIMSDFILGGLILLPSLFFISPPSDGELNLNFWLDRWNTTQLVLTAQSPLRGFLPIPAWWVENFWNTQFLLEAHSKYSWLKFVSPLISITIVGLLIFVLRDNKKCLMLFLTNLFFSFIISIVIFPLTCARHAGYIFIGFLVAYWLYCMENSSDLKKRWIINSLLAIQVIAGGFSIWKDIRLPFSNLDKVGAVLTKLPSDQTVVTDYWTLNPLSTYMDKPFYCVDLEKEKTFLLWDSDITKIETTPNRYVKGMTNLFAERHLTKLYMISLGSPQNLYATDPQLPITYHVTLVDKVEGAIEKGSNLYLYEIKKRQ